MGPAWQKLKETITFTDKRISPSAIQIQEALWRRINNVKLLFSCKWRDLRFNRSGRKCSWIRGQIMPTRNNNHRKSICMSWPLSMKQAAKFTFTHPKSRTQNIIYPPEKTIILEQTAFWHEVKDVCCLPVPFLHSVRWFEHFGRITALLLRFLNAFWIIIFARYCIVIKDIHNIKGK